jgi:hypothetical protein
MLADPQFPTRGEQLREETIAANVNVRREFSTGSRDQSSESCVLSFRLERLKVMCVPYLGSRWPVGDVRSNVGIE